MPVSDALERHRQDIEFFEAQGTQEDENGELVPKAFKPSVPLNWPVTSISNRQLQLYPEGAYTFEDRHFYQIGNERAVKAGDIFKYKGVYYLVKDFKDQSGIGNFIRYICKKIPDQSHPEEETTP